MYIYTKLPQERLAVAAGAACKTARTTAAARVVE